VSEIEDERVFCEEKKTRREIERDISTGKASKYMEDLREDERNVSTLCGTPPISPSGSSMSMRLLRLTIFSTTTMTSLFGEVQNGEGIYTMQLTLIKIVGELICENIIRA